MDPLKKLNKLGFKAQSLGPDAAGLATFRVFTDKGVTYERFEDDKAVASWATAHKPEED